jgi:hypothetical protein
MQMRSYQLLHSQQKYQQEGSSYVPSDTVPALLSPDGESSSSLAAERQYYTAARHGVRTGQNRWITLEEPHPEAVEATFRDLRPGRILKTEFDETLNQTAML